MGDTPDNSNVTVSSARKFTPDTRITGTLAKVDGLIAKGAFETAAEFAAGRKKDVLSNENGIKVRESDLRHLNAKLDLLNAVNNQSTLIAQQNVLHTTQRVLIDRQAEDIEGLNAENQKLSRLAGTDGLTGLHNRRSYDEDLAALIYKARRSLEEQERHPDNTSINSIRMTLFVADIDDFKKFNDALGHEKGDKALKLTAASLERAFRPSDRIYRYGGEEMVGLVEDLMPAETVREKIRARTDRYVIYDDQDKNPHPISLSIGVVHIDGSDPKFQGLLNDRSLTDHDIAEALFRQADQSMYHDKETTKTVRLAALHANIAASTTPEGPKSGNNNSGMSLS